MSTEGTLPAALGTGRETARRGLGVVKLLVALIVLAGAGYGASWWWRTRGRRWWHERSQKRTRRATYTVRRGDLPIIVTEKGNLKALKSEIIKCQVEGRSTIIRLVDEGTVITPEDVSKGRLLIELDSAELRERLTQQEITHATAKAAYETAKEAYDIQKSQGESNVNEARLNVKFRRMDLGKYVGETLAARALDKKVDLLDVGRKLCTAAVAERKQTAGEIDRLLAGVHTALREAAEKSRESRAPSAGWTTRAAPGRRRGATRRPDCARGSATAATRTFRTSRARLSRTSASWRPTSTSRWRTSRRRRTIWCGRRSCGATATRAAATWRWPSSA